MLSMGKLTISMAMFNSYVSLPEGRYVILSDWWFLHVFKKKKKHLEKTKKLGLCHPGFSMLIMGNHHVINGKYTKKMENHQKIHMLSCICLNHMLVYLVGGAITILKNMSS